MISSLYPLNDHSRRRIQVCRLSVVLLLTVANSASVIAESNDAESAPANCIKIELFVRRGSTLSDAAEAFLKELGNRRTGVVIDVSDVGESQAADRRARQLLAQHRVKVPGLPIVHACGQLIVGYQNAETTGRQIENLLAIDAYVRDGCPHCAAAKRYLGVLLKNYPGFEIRYHEITKVPSARDRLLELAKQYKMQIANVPAFHLCGTLVVGYDRDETTGERLRSLIHAACIPCPQAERPANPVSLRTNSSSTVKGLAFPGLGLLGFVGAQEASLDLLTSDSQLELSAEEVSREESPLDETPPAESPLEDLPLEDLLLEELPASESYQSPVPTPKDEERNIVDLPFFGEVDVRELGLPLFTIAIGLVDGFNPCAMWVLLFLLSILVNLQDRMRILAVAGTFVLISGLAYFAFMAAWLNVFLLVGFLRPAQIALGVLAVVVGSIHVKDFFAFHKGISLSIPESAKPGIYARVRKIVNAEHLTGAIVGATVLAVLVNIVELLCTAGLPALYTQILTLRELPPWQNYAYLALYNLAYMADDSLMVGIVVVTLGRRKMQQRQGEWLKLVSGAAVLVLGLILLFRPSWLV